MSLQIICGQYNVFDPKQLLNSAIIKKLELCHTRHSNIHPFISKIEKNKVWEWIQNQSNKKILTFCIVCLACHICGISIKWRIKTSWSPIYNKKYTCIGSGLTKVYPSLYLVRQDKGSWVAGIENLRHDYLYSHLPKSILQKKCPLCCHCMPHIWKPS